MLLTLFGGVIAIVSLYFVLGFTPLARYWRVVLPSGLAFTAYVAYALIAWPGLDVLAMHVAVFVITGALLGVMGARRGAAPRRPHWIPALFIGFFALLFMLYAGFIYLASHGLPDSVARHVLPRGGEGKTHTAFPGVVPHDADAAKGISTHLKQQYRQGRLGWQVEVQGLREARLGMPNPVTVRVLGRSGAPLANARVSIALLRPAREAPVKLIDASAAEAGRFVAQLAIDEPGEWVIALRVMQEREIFEIQERLNLAQ